MTTASIQQMPAAKPAAANAEPKEVRVSWKDFERKYLSREDKYKYEWVNGTVVKTPRTMNQVQQYILLNLQKTLNSLRSPANPMGELLSEVDTFFGENMRRPDIAYFTPEQIEIFRHTNQVPQFTVEIISKKEQLNAAHEKMADYRNANVAVVWHVFPKLREVHVYRGKQMTICLAGDTCSAEPAIPGFKMTVEEVFE
jgi:Uma2 family endonuclease